MLTIFIFILLSFFSCSTCAPLKVWISRDLSSYFFVSSRWFAVFFVLVILVNWADTTELGTGRAVTPLASTNTGKLGSPVPRPLTSIRLRDTLNDLSAITLSFTTCCIGLHTQLLDVELSIFRCTFSFVRPGQNGHLHCAAMFWLRLCVEFLYFLSVFFVMSLHRNKIVWPVHSVLCVVLSFGNRFWALAKHQSRWLARQTIALRYLSLFKYRIHAFKCRWTLL